MEYSIRIGGEAGQGIQTIGDTLAKVLSRNGHHVFTHQDYESRIRGGHNFFHIRFSDIPLAAPREQIDILVALDNQSIVHHAGELSGKGRILYDPAMLKQQHAGPAFLEVPFESLALEHGKNRITSNTVATGAIMGILGLDPEQLFGIIKDTFLRKGEQVIKENIAAAMSGYDYAAKNCTGCSFPQVSGTGPKMLISGIEAIAFSAAASGCKFYAAYPMTPSTGIMNYLAGKEKEYGIVVEQAEDEISAINMALGASFAGVRAMTGTSGGGFALMVEGLSLAAMTETPVVIGLGQRPGPATGLPTRTEQGDLNFALYCSHGEFPRAIFAPGTPEQAFFLTNKAFDISEKYQIPVIVIFDTYLADTQWTFDPFDLEKIRYTDYRLRGEAIANLAEYRRHALTGTGISPLGVPGDSVHLVVTDSDEHNEDGHIIEDPETRVTMVQKRLFRKLPLLQSEIEPPVFYGNESPEIIIAGWGSTYGVMKEVVDLLLPEKKIAMLHFSELYPFPLTGKFDYLSVLQSAKLTLCIENNATGQFARLMRSETGYTFTSGINKYDGRPFSVEGLLRELNARI